MISMTCKLRNYKFIFVEIEIKNYNAKNLEKMFAPDLIELQFQC